MNSRVEKIQDFVKTNVQPTTENKKGKQVSFSDQLPSEATANPRNQGASASQMHNINYVHIDEAAMKRALAISSCRSSKDLPYLYKDHPINEGLIDEETPIIIEHDNDLEDDEE